MCLIYDGNTAQYHLDHNTRNNCAHAELCMYYVFKCGCECVFGSSFIIVFPQNFTIIQDKLFAYANAKQYTYTTNNTFHTNEQITNNNFRHSLSSLRAHYTYIFVYLWTSKWWYSISKCYRDLMLLLDPLSLALSTTFNVSSVSSLCLLRPPPSFQLSASTLIRTHARIRVYYI